MEEGACGAGGRAVAFLGTPRDLAGISLRGRGQGGRSVAWEEGLGSGIFRRCVSRACDSLPRGRRVELGAPGLG